MRTRPETRTRSDSVRDNILFVFRRQNKMYFKVTKLAKSVRTGWILYVRKANATHGELYPQPHTHTPTPTCVTSSSISRGKVMSVSFDFIEIVVWNVTRYQHFLLETNNVLWADMPSTTHMTHNICMHYANTLLKRRHAAVFIHSFSMNRCVESGNGVSYIIIVFTVIESSSFIFHALNSPSRHR